MLNGLDTGSGDHRRMVNMTELAVALGHEFCVMLLGLYVFTGEDTNCAFKGKGKIKHFKDTKRHFNNLAKNGLYLKMLSWLLRHLFVLCMATHGMYFHIFYLL